MMTDFETDPNLEQPDGFYADLLAAHEGLSKPESDALNARLIFLMANQIGSREILQKVLAAAQLET